MYMHMYMYIVCIHVDTNRVIDVRVHVYGKNLGAQCNWLLTVYVMYICICIIIYMYIVHAQCTHVYINCTVSAITFILIHMYIMYLHSFFLRAHRTCHANSLLAVSPLNQRPPRKS